MGEIQVSPVAYVIQLAVAPVFLLSGIGAILAVMTSRLGRIIDRARVLEDRLANATADETPAIERDLGTLTHRARLIGPAITLCTVTALLVCTVIAILFSSAFFHFDAAVPVALLFIAAMLAFFLGLLWFLREIYVATSNLRIASRRVHPRLPKQRLKMLVAAMLCSLSAPAHAQHAPATLPAGVKAVWLGQAQRYKGAGKEMCTIVKPLPRPFAFESGVTEMTYAVELEPKTVKSAAARVIAPAGQELRSATCNMFTPITGGFSQTQLGSTLSRADKAPLVSGRYTLRITVDGQTVEVPFTIK
ncbi:MAG TPA: DUF2721 domain-containing protein [Vicinamibacterales bacterium]|nr:DUF2721 domain-containing protein [Vicinamibacterales bacterium]